MEQNVILFFRTEFPWRQVPPTSFPRPPFPRSRFSQLRRGRRAGARTSQQICLASAMGVWFMVVHAWGGFRNHCYGYKRRLRHRAKIIKHSVSRRPPAVCVWMCVCGCGCVCVRGGGEGGG